jgi:translation initiation factor IF-1
MAGDALEMTGVVREHRRGDLYQVECQAGALRRTVLAKRSGRLITNKIFVLPGDEVTIEVSPYDTTRGRITHRGPKRGAGP